MGEVKVIGKSIPAINAPKYPKFPIAPKNLSKKSIYVRAMENRTDAPSMVRFGYLMRNFIYLPINGISTLKTSKGPLM